jgi:UDP-N-acetylglucosamine 2-epimerase (non-hydrolysing)
LAHELPVVFPAHPRTRARIAEFGLGNYVRKIDEPETTAGSARILMTEPLGYLDFVHLLARARLALSDSGGLQEETTMLGVPCLTLRNCTERPVTVSAGTSILVGSDTERIVAGAREALRETARGEGSPPPLWDGHTAERIVRVLSEVL